MRVTKLVAVLLASALYATGQSAREKGIAAFNEGRYSVALPALQEAAADHTDKLAAAFLALTQAATGDCQTALPGLMADTKIERLTGVAAVSCYSAAGDKMHAFTLLDELEKKFPSNPDVLYLSSKLHMKAFNDATFEMFQRVPASYRVHELSAEIFEVQNRFSDAVSEYRKSIELNPNAADLHYRLGRAILLQSHAPEVLEQAKKEFQAELKVSPEDSACEYQLGEIAQTQGDTAQAKSDFERALALSPNFAQAMIAVGKLYAREKQYDKAISELTRATALQSGNEAAHYALLTTYRNAGQMDKAKEEKAILDRLQNPPEGEFSDFLKKLGEKQPQQ
ncbi:MAG: tetratricopeptide repeat protein [Acidobacteriota bacterium]|nr:tetratricopeptide repeat protein [Acidobacteriota bacterium]